MKFDTFYVEKETTYQIVTGNNVLYRNYLVKGLDDKNQEIWIEHKEIYDRYTGRWDPFAIEIEEPSNLDDYNEVDKKSCSTIGVLKNYHPREKIKSKKQEEIKLSNINDLCKKVLRTSLSEDDKIEIIAVLKNTEERMPVYPVQMPLSKPWWDGIQDRTPINPYKITCSNTKKELNEH